MENQIKSNQMTEEQINQHLDFISKLAGGINDMAMDRIRYLLNIRYLDGQLEGINHAKKILS